MSLVGFYELLYEDMRQERLEQLYLEEESRRGQSKSQWWRGLLMYLSLLPSSIPQSILWIEIVYTLYAAMSIIEDEYALRDDVLYGRGFVEPPIKIDTSTQFLSGIAHI